MAIVISVVNRLKGLAKKTSKKILSMRDRRTDVNLDDLISRKEIFKSDAIAIGLVVSSFDKGGLEQSVFNLYEGYWKKGIKVYVLCQTNIIGHFAKKLHSPEHLLIFNNNEKRFVDFCLHNRISWLHYHYNTFMMEKIRVLGIKTIYTIHSIYSWMSDTEIINRAKSINTADYVVAVSKFTKDYYCKRTKTPSSKVSIIPIGINTKELEGNNLDNRYTRESLGFSEQDTVLGFIASFHEIKHQMNMVGAMEKIIRTKPHANLIFLGNILQKNYYKIVKRYWENSSAKNNIIHIPYIDHAQIGQFLRETIDIFILPTIQEGCSNAVSEALYCGKPMLLTDVGNAPDLRHLESVTIVSRAYENLYSFRQKDISKISLEKESRNNNEIVVGVINIINHLNEQTIAAKSAAEEYAITLDVTAMVDNYFFLIKEAKICL